MSLVLFVTQGKNGMINTMIQSNQHFEKSVLVMMIIVGELRLILPICTGHLLLQMQ
jgi:hypothetical protein